MEYFRNSRVQYGTILILSAISICFTCIFSMWTDVNHYWISINEVIEQGKMPYSETVFEYPPLALIVFLVPRMFSWNLDSFRIAYAVWSMLAFVLSYHYSNKIADRLCINRSFVFLVYLLIILSMHEFLVARYDTFPALMILVAISKYLDKKYGWAFGIIALATMVKLYPALVACAFFYPFLSKRDFKRIIGYLGLCVLICILIELPFIIYDPSTAFNWVSYHSDRGIQVESVIGSIIEMYAYLDPSAVSVVDNFGSQNLTGPIPDTIAPYMNLIMILAMLAILIVMVVSAISQPYDESRCTRMVVLSSFALIMAFILFNKVFSAQYSIWYLTLAGCLFVKGKDLSDSLLLKLLIVNSVLCYIALCLYGAFEGYNTDIVPPFELLKNISTIVLTVAVIRGFWKTTVIGETTLDCTNTE